MLRFKETVDFGCIKPPMLVALMVCEALFNEVDADVWVTSCCDGVHKRASKHYDGFAVDLRTKHLRDTTIVEDLVLRLKSHLGSQYDVILEDRLSPNEHIHVEFDPKVGVRVDNLRPA